MPFKTVVGMMSVLEILSKTDLSLDNLLSSSIVMGGTAKLSTLLYTAQLSLVLAVYNLLPFGFLQRRTLLFAAGS